jgi:hypothetical protein
VNEIVWLAFDVEVDVVMADDCHAPRTAVIE